jgi:hypothetical protein
MLACMLMALFRMGVKHTFSGVHYWFVLADVAFAGMLVIAGACFVLVQACIDVGQRFQSCRGGAARSMGDIWWKPGPSGLKELSARRGLCNRAICAVSSYH